MLQRLEQEHLLFGRDPITWEQAMIRLPKKQNYLTEEDKGLNKLLKLRQMIRQSILRKQGASRPILADRIVQLTSEEVDLLENKAYSFRRLETIKTFDWTTVRPNTPLAKVYPTDDDNYAYYTLKTVVPKLASEEMVLVCIERNLKFISQPDKTNSTTLFHYASLTYRELNNFDQSLNLPLFSQQ